MNEFILIGLASLIVVGIAAQWISWRYKIPSILLLLIFGILAGPVLNLLDPDKLFGDLLFPFVSISASIILFEGGLSLHFSEFKKSSGIIRNLITVGNIITWGLTTLAVYYILNLQLDISLLLAAILIVTGPTVIIPLLHQVKPKGKVNSILKWEGIVNDPIGAILSVIVLEVILTAGVKDATTVVILTIVKSILVGSILGIGTGYLLVHAVKHNLIPDYLENPVTLALVVGIFVISNSIQPESGLITVTLMGIYLGNQKSVVVHHIIEFKENLRVLLISLLFIVLAARLKISDLKLLDVSSFLFVLSLIFIIRPLSIFISTYKSTLKLNEKIFLSAMAPRGIVAAAITSLFAIELGGKGIDNSELLVPLMFLIIISTITVYGLGAFPLTKKLKLADSNPQGCLIVGAHKLAQSIAKALQDEGFKTMLIDTNSHNVLEAKLKGLNAIRGNVLSETIEDELDFEGIGKLLAITPNNEVNSLAALHFSTLFGSQNVFQVGIDRDKDGELDEVSKELRGTILFNENTMLYTLEHYIIDDSSISSTKITEDFNIDDIKAKYGEQNIIPMFLINSKKELLIYSVNNKPVPQPGDILMNLVINPK